MTTQEPQQQDYTDSHGDLWHIRYTCPPIPTRQYDWEYWHDDYDGAPDAFDPRSGNARTPRACRQAIEEWIYEGDSAHLNVQGRDL